MIEFLWRTIRKFIKPYTQKWGPDKTPEGFRGKITYKREDCIGCGLCVRNCPALAIKMKENRKVKFDLTLCSYCGTCEEVCPKKCIKLTQEYLMTTTDKHSKELTVE